MVELIDMVTAVTLPTTNTLLFRSIKINVLLHQVLDDDSTNMAWSDSFESFNSKLRDSRRLSLPFVFIHNALYLALNFLHFKAQTFLMFCFPLLRIAME